MNDSFSFLLRGDQSLAPVNFDALLLGMLLAFLLSQSLAWVYMATHSGVSYSRSFVRSLVVTPMIVTAVMVVLAHNLVTAFGLLAVFAIVRFRNILRDTLDTAYVLMGIVIGMACGTQRFSTAAIASAVVALVLLYLWISNFGTRQRYDLILNFQWQGGLDNVTPLKTMLARHGRHVQLANQRVQEGWGVTDLSFRLLMRDPDRLQDLVAELSGVEGVQKVQTLFAADESES